MYLLLRIDNPIGNPNQRKHLSMNNYPNLGRVFTDAAENGNLQEVKKLLGFAKEKGITDLIHIDEDAALRKACIYGFHEVVEYLLSQGADVHAAEDDAFVLAAWFGHRKILDVLIVYGANIHAQDDAAVILAADHDYLDVVEFLIFIGLHDLKVLEKAYKGAGYDCRPYLRQYIDDHSVIVDKKSLAQQWIN